MPNTSLPRPRHRRPGVLAAALAAALVLALLPAASAAVSPATGTVIDDFEDGDTSDWGFFGGNAAGGGGGPLADRPQAGGFYFSTGWGGQGTASAFYGGAFKNFTDTSQPAVPAVDPWLNLWVYNQSDATVDGYTLEVTIREDTDGNGWTNGADDSFRLDTTFTSADFDDEWRLISAQLSSLTDLGTGGDGTFDGNLDEIVIVIAGVEGTDPSTVEVDFDSISFTTGGPAAFDEVVFDDMEHGDPFGNGWFTFGGSVGGGGIGPNAADLPPADGGAISLESGWGSGGTPGFFGGFGRTNPVDLAGTDHFNFWINPDAGQDYTLEINLQEDDNGNGAVDPSDDDEFQFNCVVSPTGPCATAGGGWQLVSVPLDDFFDDNSFFTGGNGVLDPMRVDRGGNGELVNALMVVISNSGADVTFRTDHWTFTSGPAQVDLSVPIDDFSTGVAPGTPCPPGTPPLGFCTFAGAGSSVALLNPETPPAPALPTAGTPNSVLQMDVDVTSFAGFIHGFTNAAADTWVPQDWSTSEGIRFWLHGSNSGTDLFLDVLDNRNPGSTTDDAERWTVAFVDDFTGWQQLEFPFSSLVRKEIGNGAPNDGLGLFQMHGYAIGTLGTGGPQTFFFDDVELYGIAEPPAPAISLSTQNTFIEEGETGDVRVKLNRPLGPDDPTEVSIDYATERSNAVAGEEYTPTSGTLTFTNGGPSELSFSVETFDDTTFEGDEQIVVRLTNPVDVDRGALFQGSVLIADDDPFDPDLPDDFTQGHFLWEADEGTTLSSPTIGAGDADARPGQDDHERVLAVDAPGVDLDAEIDEVATEVGLLLDGATDRDADRIDKALRELDKALEDLAGGDDKAVRNALKSLRKAVKELDKLRDADASAIIETLVTISAVTAQTQIDIAIRNGGDQKDIDKALREMAKAQGEMDRGKHDKAVDRYRKALKEARKAVEHLGRQGPPGAGRLSMTELEREFPLGQDWTNTESVQFWFDGTGSGEDVVFTLADNRAPDPGPAGWELTWADEFDAPAGTVPNPDNWGYELGDVTPDGKNGWGNEELQYYTDDPDNAQHDGAGNLVITLDEADGTQECYYGPCEYESARLLSQHRAEFAYGRIESRLQVPDGGDGLWPAFWSLGTDITRNPWPGAGEIDIMEYVSRLPNEIFGTVHGPGYNGGGSIGGIYDFGQPVFDDTHTFAVEWEPELITWYVDGIQYHQVTPADVPGPWVFEKPFFLLLNFAIGGNFGGPVDAGNTYPQEYAVDYVRVYQAPDTAERFEATFADDVDGWQLVTIPIGDFTRSADQPAGAPDDGLTLDDVWGYAIDLPAGSAGATTLLDEIRRVPVPPPTELTVTTTEDSGAGSLREALGLIANGGTITIDEALAGTTIELTGGELVVDRGVTIDSSGALGLVLDAGGASRVLTVTADGSLAMSDVVITGGAAAPQGGGILNLGTLTLDRVTVSGNTLTAPGPANFAFGGGGIYNGENAVLVLTDSTVADNGSTNHPGGGVFGFFGSDLTITRSTISGNVSGDVAGGIRSLGDTTITNSTISGNTSTAWHGGGIFHTDGSMVVTNSTFADNIAPAGTASGILVATFGAPADATLTNNVLEGEGGAVACAIEGGGAATITSGGGNVISDGSCNPAGSDQTFTAALLGTLADNGGPTLTQVLGAGSPAIDAAEASACPTTDQRGSARPQGAGCDAGAIEAG